MKNFSEAAESHSIYMSELARIISQTDSRPSINSLYSAYKIMGEVILKQGLVICCGNGGSAADASHIATELVCRFEHERLPIRAISLNSDPQLCTAIANDYSFDLIFSRQIEAFAGPGDVLLILSTSGNSKNCLLAAQSARRKGAKVILFTGSGAGVIRAHADIIVEVPSIRTSHIQEVHRIQYHLLCSWLEADLVQGRLELVKS